MTTMPSSNTIPSQRTAWVMLAFLYVYVAWGATYMGVHYALQSLPPFLLVGDRFIIAGFILLALVRIFHLSQFHWGSLREWRDALVVGLLLIGGNGMLVWSQQYVNTSTAALIFGCAPLCMILIEWLRPGGVRPSVRTGLGLAFGFVGLCVLIKPSTPTPDTHMEIWGKLVLVLASCFWSAGAIYSRHVHAVGSPLLPMARQMIMGGVSVLALSVVHGDWIGFHVEHVTFSAWMGFAYLVVFGSLFGFTAYVWLMRVSTPARVATITYVNLVVAVAIGWTLGGEPVTLRVIVGAGIILASVMLVLTKGQNRELVNAAPTEA